ncbi:MAG: UPF0149 family protein [Gammaproteobacteria bacterium]|nr:UPF0149 family protein [Gammaproteobacteria bacterium]
MSSTLPDFDRVQSALDRLKAMTDAAEAHGTLCGMLLGQQDFSRWLVYTLDQQPDANDLLAKEQLEVLRDLYEYSKQLLNADDMSLELLLPNEDQEFAQRLVGLAAWCQGFLYGLGVSGERLLESLSEQGRECMDDILQISQLAHDEESNEQNENVYAEIVEHVRLSVIYMNEEINPLISTPQVQ